MNLERLEPLEIRAPNPEDYEAIARLHNADNEPHFHTTAAQLAASDSSGARRVAVQAGAVLGTSERWWWGAVDAYRIAIHADAESVARQLLTDLERDTLKAKRLLATVRADFLEGAHYLRHGFREVFRSFGANLELESYQPERFSHLEAELARRGVRIVPRREWRAPGGDAQLEAIQREGNADLPGYEPVVTTQMNFRDRTLLEAFWVALQGVTCVGFASLDGKPERSIVHFDSSAVQRNGRHQGIGLALAARAVAWAKARGYNEVNDGGAKTNTAQIRILERLGFELEPDWVTFEKRLEGTR